MVCSICYVSYLIRHHKQGHIHTISPSNIIGFYNCAIHIRYPNNVFLAITVPTEVTSVSDRIIFSIGIWHILAFGLPTLPVRTFMYHFTDCVWMSVTHHSVHYHIGNRHLAFHRLCSAFKVDVLGHTF